jgi:hypothetical protein
MDAIMKLPREAQATLAGLILFIILSFFNWQEYSFGPYSVGRSLWHGFGIITILVAIAYLIWEIGRAMNYEVKLGEVTPGMTSAGLAIALLVCTVIVFLDWSQYRAWPMYAGSIVAILIAVVAFPRAKKEGVTMPKMPENISVGRSAAGGTAAAAAAAPAAPPEPAAPAEPPAPPPDDAGAAPGSTEA